MSRSCKIDPAGGQVTIRLSVNNALISGGNFKIYGLTSGTLTEEFNLQTGTTGLAEQISTLTPAILNGQVLSWMVSTCAPVVTSSGNVVIEIYQNGQLCPCLPPAIYSLSSVPDCASGNALPLHGGLLFTF
jgi:hypothetical protein